MRGERSHAALHFNRVQGYLWWELMTGGFDRSTNTIIINEGNWCPSDVAAARADDDYQANIDAACAAAETDPGYMGRGDETGSGEIDGTGGINGVTDDAAGLSGMGDLVTGVVEASGNDWLSNQRDSTDDVRDEGRVEDVREEGRAEDVSQEDRAEESREEDDAGDMNSIDDGGSSNDISERS